MTSGVPVPRTRRHGAVLFARIALVVWAVLVYVAYVIDQLPRVSGLEGLR